MANDANYGFEHRFAFGANPHTWGASSSRFEVVSSSFGDKDEVLDGMGLLGVRGRREDRSRYGLIRCEGDIVLEPSIRMLDFFMSYITGIESTDTFAPTDSLTAFDMFHDPFSTGAHSADFDEIYVNRASLRFGAGLLRLTLSCIGKTVTHNQTWSGSIPALGATALLDDPLAFYDSASGFTIDGQSSLPIEEGELIIDNVLDVRFRNSQTAQSIRATDRIVSLVTNIPLTSALKTVFFGDNAAADATIVLTRGSVSATFTLFNLKAPDEWPGVGGKGEQPLILRSVARRDSSDPDINVVIDETV